MSVVLSIEDVGPWRKELRIEVPAPAVDAEAGRVVKQLGKGLRLPGFRKGKVPASIIRRRFGDDVERELVERLVPRYWSQAKAEKTLDPLTPPEIGEVEYHEGEPLQFVATVEVRPEIELEAGRDFELPEVSVVATEEEIDRVIEGLRSNVADWVAVDREAAVGDAVVIEITELSSADKDADPQTVEVELGDERVWEELRLALTGARAKQKTEFTRSEGEGEEAVVRRFAVAVMEVKEKDLPPVDDELAEKIGGFEDLAALRQQVAQQLELDKKGQRRQQREQALVEQLIERNPLELPKGVVEREVQRLLEDYAENLAGRGVDVNSAEIDWSQIALQVRPQAERRVHARLLLDAVAEGDEIGVREEDLEAALNHLARAQNKSSAVLRRAMAEDGRLEALRAQLRRERAVTVLLGEEEQQPEQSDTSDQASETSAGATSDE